jgi:hypothetical protein
MHDQIHPIIGPHANVSLLKQNIVAHDVVPFSGDLRLAFVQNL